MNIPGRKLSLTGSIFKFSDIIAFMKIFKANGILYPFIGDFDLRKEKAAYQMPMYYLLGGDDWQTPYMIAQQYFEEIEPPRKGIQLIPGAGHMTMMDQPDLFFDALHNIYSKEEMNAQQLSFA